MLFLAPFLLAGLALLPALWYLLYIHPPKPLTQIFPAIEWLRTLNSAQHTPQHPKIWRMILRMAAISLIIVGFAQPFLLHASSQKVVSTHRPLLMVIDNGWASIAQWSQLKTIVSNIVAQTQLEGRPVAFLSTTPTESGQVPRFSPTQEEGTPQAFLNNLHPEPWPEERAMAASTLVNLHEGLPDAEVIYFSDRLQNKGDDAFYQALHLFGQVEEHQFAEKAAQGQVAGKYTLLLHADPKMKKLSLAAWPTPFARVFSIRYQTAQAHTLGLYTVSLPANMTDVDIPFSLPESVRAQIERISIDGQETPGSTLYVNAGAHYRPVGLLGGQQSQIPLVGNLYYTRHALEKFADLHQGTLDQLLAQRLSIIIAPDGSLNAATDRHKLTEWVKKGGTLIRFAGPSLAHMDRKEASSLSSDNSSPILAAETLLPVPLLDGIRQFGSGMSWGKPQKLAHFASQSPFTGLQIPADITVTRQILAMPDAKLGQHVWAQLEDGTPLVTHAPLGEGHIVLFHVPGTPSWSNLPLSGLFVSMLERLIDTAQGIAPPDANAILPPLSMIGENGMLVSPALSARPLSSTVFDTTPVTYIHPAGLYGSSTQQKNLNIGTTLKNLITQRVMASPASIDMHTAPTALGPLVFLLGFLLLLVDYVLGSGSFPKFTVPAFLAKRLGMVLFLGTGLMTNSTHAAPFSAPPPQAALETRLAYIRTGNAAIDTISEQGLAGLSAYVNARTSAILGHPDGIDPDRDDMTYYPLIYWPIGTETQIDKKRAAALNGFMAHGGILLIDTQGTDASATQKDDDETHFIKFTANSTAALKRATEGINIPPLVPLSPEHVLSHTFYLLRSFPGRYTGAPLWVAQDENSLIDGVSPLIIGANDWAHAWAVNAQGQTPYAVLPGGEQQRQMAYRVGVNMVIYALTGNYKADQTHVPELLRRLQNDH